jgi:sugar phosphate isomerase/epimerase
MKRIARRDFLEKSLMIGAAAAASQWPLNLSALSPAKSGKLPLGFQIWTIRDQLIKDFSGTLKMTAGLGYQTVEMCSPPGYGFEPLMKIKPKEMLQMINEAGLRFDSTHYGMDELRNNLDDRIEFAAESGQKQMILSGFGLPAGATMSDWMRAADDLNKIGLKTKDAGIQMGYHNHHLEFEKIDGVLIYDALMNQFDPDRVKMQFQVAVISIGYQASTYFNKYPGRFISAHLADWSAVEQKNVAIGKGIVDWKGFFDSAKIGGVKNIFVEMDPETFQDSETYYHSL